ncbi:hypothetical protein PENTCL1PPCAC_2661 [Pristionchus entomophagus]|uniref:Arrestin-like N-terminal domain-containing protein n=1 Tax=Pristionchus entomophagus TaxID=358040 RepID=A0AAV5SB25_9BILA|nr:hypothetical protein PENTCL1PPCAC_2661 [Pristionchus entomophagus]
MEDRYEDAIPTSLVVLIIVACVIGVISVVGLIIYCVWKCGKKEEIAERIRDLEEAKEKAEFSIEFYNPNTVFIPGVEVTGSVTLTVNEPVIAKAIIISIHGKAKTHFIV